MGIPLKINIRSRIILLLRQGIIYITEGGGIKHEALFKENIYLEVVVINDEYIGICSISVAA